MTAALMNKAAFGSLAHRCGLRVGCNRMLACSAEAEDAIQETRPLAWQHA